jgi:hypothetical protein
MRYSKSLKVMVAGLFLLFSLSALAANSGSLTLSEPAQLNGKQLKSGDYKVKWEGTGQDVQVSILQGKNVVASAPAKLMEAANKESGNSVVLNHDGGATTIHEIHLVGKKQILIFDTGAGGSAAQTSVR